MKTPTDFTQKTLLYRSTCDANVTTRFFFSQPRWSGDPELDVRPETDQPSSSLLTRAGRAIAGLWSPKKDESKPAGFRAPLAMQRNRRSGRGVEPGKQ